MTETTSNSRSRLAQWLFVGCGVWLIGLGAYFIFVRPPLLPEDPRYMGATLAQIQQTMPGLALWLKRVFTVMGGFMAAAGVLCFAVAEHAHCRNQWVAMAAAGLVGVGVMSAVNFQLDSDFKWVLVGPVILWCAAVLAAARRSA